MVSPCTGLPVHFLLSIVLEFEKVISRGGHQLEHSMAAEANQATDWRPEPARTRPERPVRMPLPVPLFQHPSPPPTPPGSNSLFPVGLFSPVLASPGSRLAMCLSVCTIWWPTHKAPNWGFWARSGSSLSMEMVGSGCRL